MERQRNNTIAFNSAGDLANYFERHPGHVGPGSAEWLGGISREEAVIMLKTGDTSLVAEAQNMLDDYNIRIETSANAMVDEVAGFAPCVPAYISGAPESMYAMAEVESNQGLLKIIVDPSSSAGVKPGMLRRRGTAILAATLALSAIRPVQLEVAILNGCGYAYAFPDGSRYSCVRVAINSQPIDLGTACFALCHPAFVRALIYGVSTHEFGWFGDWPEVIGIGTMSETRNPKVIAKSLELLGEDEATTLFAPAIHKEDDLVLQPKKWLREVMKKYGQIELA